LKQWQEISVGKEQWVSKNGVSSHLKIMRVSYATAALRRKYSHGSSVAPAVMTRKSCLRRLAIRKPLGRTSWKGFTLYTGSIMVSDRDRNSARCSGAGEYMTTTSDGILEETSFITSFISTSPITNFPKSPLSLSVPSMPIPSFNHTIIMKPNLSTHSNSQSKQVL
jgi:hypothetical protein